jgi:hypothetical protein
VQYISILSTIISFIFATAVLRRYSIKRTNHLLFWGIGLVFYGLGTLTEVILAFTFSEWVIKFLVRKRGVARSLAVVLVILSLISLGLMIAAPITPEAVSYDVSQLASAQYKDILVRNGATRGLTILLNVYGTIALVGGAIYSAYLFWRKKVLAKRMVGNILIAAGALMPAMAGTFVKAGLVDWLYVSELIGVILMYAGFLLAMEERTPEVDVMTSATLE